MKKQFLLPFTFLFSLLFGFFLIGAIVGSIVTSVMLQKNKDNIPLLADLEKDSNYAEQQVTVVEVTDGDTISVKKNDEIFKVRYLGIDAPEDKQDSPPSFYAKEALEKNKLLVEGKKVILAWDKEYYNRQSDKGIKNIKKVSTDSRLWAYVYVDNIFVNAELIKNGYAYVYRRGDNKPIQHLHSKYFNELEQEARSNQLGVWNEEGKRKWEKENLQNGKQSAVYIADSLFYHRPECKKAKDLLASKLRCFHYYTKEAAKNDGKRACLECIPNYIADKEFFHRPGCPKLKELKDFECFIYDTREEAMRDGKKNCPICKP
ncbi:MAG: thermonuclease family protein [Candidatus Brocadiae bacterium]|nr:thermonuclease family protein [Candidatus Brocadiia bacterium]